MLHNHQHNHCSHELKFCSHCDVAYCGKCLSEWKKQTFSYGQNNPFWVTNGLSQISAENTQAVGSVQSTYTSTTQDHSTHG